MEIGLGMHRTAAWSAQDECTLLHKLIERQANRIDVLERRLDALPPAPTPAEPAPAPETPDALATRLLNDPETLAAVIISVAAQSCAIDRQSLHDEIQKSEREIPAGSHAHCLRLLAATIAAASFGK